MFILSSILEVSMNKIALWIVSVWMIGQPNELSLPVLFFCMRAFRFLEHIYMDTVVSSPCYTVLKKSKASAMYCLLLKMTLFLTEFAQRVKGEGGEKHQIYATAFSGHLLFLQGQEVNPPRPPTGSTTGSQVLIDLSSRSTTSVYLQQRQPVRCTSR